MLAREKQPSLFLSVLKNCHDDHDDKVFENDEEERKEESEKKWRKDREKEKHC
jgi:hypothetical protein